VFRDLHDIRTVKMYDQPNLELGRDQDFCDPIGTIQDVHFQNLVYHLAGIMQIAANVDGLFLDDVRLHFDLNDPKYRDFKLVEIGPMSQTIRVDPNQPSTWIELFSPDRDVTVRNFHLTHVAVQSGDQCVPRPDADFPPPSADSRLVRVTDQKPNPDYPKTTPRGGTGKTILLP
jgi:hypothetical protein